MAVIDTWSTARSRFIRARSRLTAREALAAPTSPGHRRTRPKGTTASRCSAAAASTAATSSWVVGRTTTSGCRSGRPPDAKQVGRGLYRRCAAGGSRRRCGRARPRRRRPGPPSAAASTVGRASSGSGTAGRSSTPTPSPPVRRPPRSAWAQAGSPQRDGCISICSTHHAGYTVTHDVTSSQPDQAGRRSGRARGAYLDAARDCVLDVGWRRTTLTEVARRAGVSRMTIYRTWVDMPQLLADLMTRGGAVSWPTASPTRTSRPTVDRIVGDVVGTVRRLRENTVLRPHRRELDPEFSLLLLSRRGPVPGRDPGDSSPGRSPTARPRAPYVGQPLAIARAAAGSPRLGAVRPHDGRRRGVRGRAGRRFRPPADPEPAAMSRQPTTVVASTRAPGSPPDWAPDRGRPGRHRSGHHRHRRRARRRRTWPVGAGGRRARPRPGTSRWSSKMVHGGLRYLANGQGGRGARSAVERGIMMEVTARTWSTRCRCWCPSPRASAGCRPP